MCGIAGFFLKNRISAKEANKILSRMQRSLHHRGPDGNGRALFSDDGSGNSVYGGFSHTRLSILDLTEGGSQPMFFNDYCITYNGEVYNFHDIRKELTAIGYSFQSQSDTEVILKAYAEWGEGALEKFRGMFAFVIYNTKTRELFCARDRIGIKPFYFYEDENLFLFASDVTTLIASGLYEPEINWTGVKLGTLFQGAPRPLTCYQDVFALEPGYLLKGHFSEKLKKKEYWQIPLGQKLEISEKHAIQRLEELIHESVALHLVSDTEVATLMSGGIDSTTLSAFACLIHPKIKAFTLSYDPKLNLRNELVQAKAFAAMYPFEHIITEVTEQNVSDSLSEMVSIFEEPIAFIEPHYAIAKHISEHGIKVVLNGLGPDELLGGYGYYRLASLWKYLRPFALLSPFVPKVSKFASLKKIMQSKTPYELHFKCFANYLKGGRQLFSNEKELDRSALDYMHSEVLNHPALMDYQDPQQAISYADLKIYIGTHHNHTTDRFLMHFGIEGRFPFLDHKIVEFCVMLPQSMKRRWKENQSKFLLREVAKKYIHPDCLAMKKEGFGVTESLISGQYLENMKERALSLRSNPYFDKKTIENACSNNDKKLLLYLGNFEEWNNLFIKKNHSLFRESVA